MLVLLLSAAFVAATALLVMSTLADGSVTQWLVGAYVVGFCEVVLVSLLLSAFSAFSRWPMVGTLGGICAIAAVASRFRAPPFPPVRPAMRVLFGIAREPTVAVLAVVALGVVGYSLALGLFRPPNDDDALTYHLARAAFWRQQHGIGYIPGARDIRLNTFAPNAEIAMAFTMVTAAGARYAALVELTAALAAAGAVYGIARRVGIALQEALLAALLFVTLPVVALQMSTGLNDVVVAALAACCVFFLLGATRANLILATLSLALLVGTKLTGLVAIPGLALVALAAHGRRAVRLIPVFAVGLVAGAYWYWLDVARGSDLTGGVSGEHVGGDVAAAVSRIVRLLLDAVELPGAIGLERLWYVVAAAAVAAIALTASGPRRARVRTAALASGVALVPLLLVPVDHLVVRGTEKMFFELGRNDVGNLDPHRSATKASPIFSWYGPASVLLTVLACVVAVRGYRRGCVPRAAVALAFAPVVWIVLLGATVPYWEWNGRYVMAGWTIGVAAWAFALVLRPVAWATTALAVVTVLLAFVHLHDRASGVRLLVSDHEPAVWSETAWHEQATDHPDLEALYRFAATRIPSDARVAIQPVVWPGNPVPAGNLPPFPFFGRSLSRTVVLAPSPARAAAAGAAWAILPSPGCARGWRVRFRYGAWRVLERAPAAPCSSSTS